MRKNSHVEKTFDIDGGKTRCVEIFDPSSTLNHRSRRKLKRRRALFRDSVVENEQVFSDVERYEQMNTKRVFI
jgi:hypothetical protein